MIEMFPLTEFSKTEEVIIAECLCNPAVQKYLKYMGYSVGRQIILAEMAPEESAEAYMRRVAHAKGMVQAFTILLERSQAEQKPAAPDAAI